MSARPPAELPTGANWVGSRRTLPLANMTSASDSGEGVGLIALGSDNYDFHVQGGPACSTEHAIWESGLDNSPMYVHPRQCPLDAVALPHSFPLSLAWAFAINWSMFRRRLNLRAGIVQALCRHCAGIVQALILVQFIVTVGTFAII